MCHIEKAMRKRVHRIEFPQRRFPSTAFAKTRDRLVVLGCEEPEGQLWNMASEQRTESAELSGLDYDRIRLLQRSILGQSIQYERDTIRV